MDRFGPAGALQHAKIAAIVGPAGTPRQRPTSSGIKKI